MLINATILFAAAFAGGLVALRFKNKNIIPVKDVLVFAGAFLFSVTILHILPELFQTAAEPFYIGSGILAGFYFQQILEYFTNGVEHGHMHTHAHHEKHSSMYGASLMIALCVHAFLEGTVLSMPSVIHDSHGTGSLLLGIVLHKAPEAIALITVLACQYTSKRTQFLLLTIFAISSPIGMLAGHWIVPTGLMSSAGMIMLFAFVAGNFLHISTTIFIESSPNHHWNARKLVISLVGTGLAVLLEMVV